jgi:integrase
VKRGTSTSLHRAVSDYLALRRTLGFKLYHETWWLPDFATYLQQQRSAFVTSEVALRWATMPTDVDRSWWGRRLGAVRQFARHHHAVDPRTEIPSSSLIPFRTPRRTPYLYADNEVLALMQHAKRLPNALFAAGCATLIGLLAATGMRVSEALGLDDADLDRREPLLSIRGAKFNKSREVPIDASTLQALVEFTRRRDRLRPHRDCPSLFLSATGLRLPYQRFQRAFRRLTKQAKIGDKPEEPRIHDLRHTFAVTTMRRWYRAGVDVEPRLAWLSTYLGHVAPTTTYWYLTATPDLLALAAKRLERAKVATS